MKYLNRIHPIVSFFYFFVNIFISMFTKNPIILIISISSSIILYGLLTDWNKIFKTLFLILLLIIVASLINPLFSSLGDTILFKIGKVTFTKESIIYGMFSSIMIVSVLFWFMSYSIIFTSDKFVYLFGKIIPKLSLVLSITLNFIPRFLRYYKEVSSSQKALGIYEGVRRIEKIKNKFRIFSIVLGISLESAIETADSMKARGYGVARRSNYSIFKWKKSDTFLLIFWFLLSSIIITFIVMNYSNYSYYPTLERLSFEIEKIILYLSFFMLSFSSIILEIKENILWKLLKSKI